jgi:hypothetical protein
MNCDLDDQDSRGRSRAHMSLALITCDHEEQTQVNAQEVGRPQLRSAADAAAACQIVHGRVDAPLRDCTHVGDLNVPACPDWSVLRTVSHLVGSAEDIVSQNVQGAGTDAWTQAQVNRLAAHGLRPSRLAIRV